MGTGATGAMAAGGAGGTVGAGGGGATAGTDERSVRLALNGKELTELSLAPTSDSNTWSDHELDVLLTAGINRVTVKVRDGDDSDGVRIDYLEVVPTDRSIASYEAEASSNTIAGAAIIEDSSGASGGQAVGAIGEGSENTLTFNGVSAPEAGATPVRQRLRWT